MFRILKVQLPDKFLHNVDAPIKDVSSFPPYIMSLPSHDAIKDDAPSPIPAKSLSALIKSPTLHGSVVDKVVPWTCLVDATLMSEFDISFIGPERETIEVQFTNEMGRVVADATVRRKLINVNKTRHALQLQNFRTNIDGLLSQDMLLMLFGLCQRLECSHLIASTAFADLTEIVPWEYIV